MIDRCRTYSETCWLWGTVVKLAWPITHQWIQTITEVEKTLSMTSPTRLEVSSESYMTPCGETLLGARWPKSLLTMKAITKSVNAPLWHRSASHLRKQMEWISLHNISNRRAGSLIWTWESTFLWWQHFPSYIHAFPSFSFNTLLTRTI